jgi:hypothetical protein
VSVLEPRDAVPWDEGGPLSTIYDVLRKLIDDSPWSEEDRRRAVALVKELEQFNVFGTVAQKITMKESKR